MTAGTIPAPIQIPGRSPRRTRDPSGASQRAKQAPTLAMAASVVLVSLVGMELYWPHETVEDAQDWSIRITHLVFPSNSVTWIKLVGLTLGFVLTTSYFLASQAQLASAEKMMVDSATVLVPPLRKSPLKPMTNDSNAPTPTGKTAAAWLASRSQSLLHTNHFGGDQQQKGETDEIPQLKIRDECKERATPMPVGDSSDFEAVNRAQPLAFESEYFSGHVLFMARDSTKSPSETRKGNWDHLFGTRKRMLWVQVQGRFKRPLPPRAVMYLATELPDPNGFQVAFLRRQLVNLLITLVKKFVPMAHIAFGEEASNKADSELPHAAFPFYQTVDEFVVTDDSETEKAPLFGQEVFGESSEAKKSRVATPVGMEPAVRTDAVYSFQFYTMYSDLAQWKIVNVPGLPDMDLKRFCGSQPIRLAMYAVITPGFRPEVLCEVPHKTKDKGYVFCFSMHHTADKQAGERQNVPGSSIFSPTAGNALTPPPGSPLRWRSASYDQPDPVVCQQTRAAEAVHATVERLSEVSTVEDKPQPRIRASSSVRSMSSLERAADLSNWKFSLPLWVERVDPIAGNRKVSYLFVVEEKEAARPTRRCVVRSAHTVKNALLLLDAAGAREFKKLIVESREFLYESISRETDQVAQALEAIAAIPTDQATEVNKDRKAMLFNCLMSESQLPCVRSFQDIGIQLTKAKRDQLDIIFENGIYRMPDARYLRQEWFIVTTTELHFFRSFTLKPSKTVQLAHVLGMRPVHDVPFFEAIPAGENKETPAPISPSSPRHRDATMRSTNRWFCLEIHVLSEILTIFFDCASDRELCMSSITQLIKLKSGSNTGNERGRLPPLRPIDAVTAPLCLNLRKRLPIGCGTDMKTPNPVTAAEHMVEKGLRVFGRPRQEIVAADVIAFLDAVDQLCEVAVRTPTTTATPPEPEQWFSSSDSRIAFALNIFHGLYIHAWLLFGDVRTPAQWKKLKTMVFYALGNPRAPGAPLRITLGDIEHTLLMGRQAPGEEHRTTAGSTAVPAFLMPEHRDYRTSFVLQTNSAPSVPRVLRVYHAASLSSQLDEACAVYLENDVAIDDLNHVIQLPRICEWNLDDYVKGSPIVQPGSRAFFCLQKLLPLMHPTQHDRIQHLLLGASKEYQIRFSTRFWTQDLKSSSSDSASAEHAAVTAVRARDDTGSTAPVTGSTASETSSSTPKGKNGLQFFQSLF